MSAIINSNAQLLNKTQFKHALNNTQSPLSIFKDTLQQGLNKLTESFKTGKDIEFIVSKQTWLIDQLLTEAWGLFINDDAFCLVAVGGYGRGELLLHSDIDLMIIEKPKTSQDSKAQLEQFLVFLWDVGLEVGHSVRTVKECRLEAKNDITVITNMMESRVLHGNQELHEQMLQAISPKKIWPTKKFFAAKLS